MTFERSKVVDSLCDNLEQWVNWKGVVSDNLKNLKEIVENIHSEDNVKYKVVDVDTQSNTPFMTDRGLYWQFFYPVVSPEKPKMVPFDSTREFLDWYCAKYNWSLSGLSFPTIWLRDKTYGNVVFVNKFVFKSSVRNDGTTVSVGEAIYTMENLLNLFTLLDGTPIGKEEDK